MERYDLAKERVVRDTARENRQQNRIVTFLSEKRLFYRK